MHSERSKILSSLLLLITPQVPNYGTIIEITGNETVIKNTFRFGIQVFGYSGESVQLPGSFQCTCSFKEMILKIKVNDLHFQY